MEKQNEVKAFGTEQEYAEFVKLKEEMARTKLEQEIREKIMKEIAATVSTTKGIVTQETAENSVAEKFKGYIMSKNDSYSKGHFITRG